MAKVFKRQLTFLSELPSEVTNLTWNVDNFQEMIQVGDTLKKIQLKFDAGESIQLPSKWGFSLKTDKLSEGKMGLFLELLDSPKDQKEVYASYEAVIKSSNGSDLKTHVTGPKNMKDLPDWGWLNAFGPVSFISQNMLTSGTLVLDIKFTLFGFENASGSIITTEQHTRHKIARFQETSKDLILDDLERLFDQGSNSDFKILMKDGEELPAHKTVLAARSPVFSAMLGSNMKEASSGVVEVTDLSFEAMKIVLKFMYTGRVDENWKEVVEDVVYAAEKYALTSLKDFCDMMLIDAATPENAINLRKLAGKYKLQIAETDLKNYTEQNWKKVLEATML